MDPFIPRANFRTSTAASYYWAKKKDKRRTLIRIKQHAALKAQRAAEEEGGEEEGGEEAAAEEGEGEAEAAAAEGGEAEEAAAEEEEAAAGEQEAAEGEPKKDTRPETWEWQGHPYDYPWTDEEREECWFTEEELPREVYDRYALDLGDIDDPITEDGRVRHPPSNMDDRAKAAYWAGVKSLHNEHLDEIMDEMIFEYREDHGPRPMLSQRTKDQMHELHKLDPVNWNLETLSLKFGLSKARVKVLLMFSKMEEVAAAHGELLPNVIEPELEREFGVVDRYNDKIELQTHRDQEKIWGQGDEELIDAGKVKEHLKRHLPKRPPPEEMPLEPPVELVNLREAKILFEPSPNKPYKRKGMIVMDSDDEKAYFGRSKQKKDDKTRLIWIHEPMTGVIRTPTWMERYWISKKMHPPKPNYTVRDYAQKSHMIDSAYLKNFGSRRAN